MLPKANTDELHDRFREIVSDPLNLLIERVPTAGTVHDEQVVLHSGLRVPAKGTDAYYGDFSTVLPINRRVHDPLEEFAFHEVVCRLPVSLVMLELGASWGHYSMWMKPVRPDCNVYLVGPERDGAGV